MTEKRSGLRFDIYERVHLQDGARSIQELDEVELVPHIQVVSHSDQAVLKGYLRLNGTYTADGEEGTKLLEHQIPVEITLPLSRVGNAQDLSVEIENFDIDLLSPRSLNVTGVLSLHGVETALAEEQDGAWSSDEEVVFVHRPEEGAGASSPEPDSEVRSQPEEQAQPLQEEVPRAVEAVLIEPSPQAHAYSHPTASPAADTAEPAVFAAAQEANPHAVNVDINVEETDVMTVQAQLHGPELEPVVELHSEKKDVKVAFGSKKVAELAQEATYGIKSLLHKSSSIFLDKRNKAAAEAAAELQAEAARADAVEWKKLFLGSTADGQEFRRLKLVIVQKEETLETIAQRYQLNPRELQLLNRLQDGGIRAGQVIYIPK